jgi:hypothetical protein
MSWDVLVLNLGGKLPPGDAADADPVGPLGSAAQVRRRIAKHLPGVDWSDSTWGVYEGDGFTIEFNTGDDDPIDSIMVHVRGGGDVIAALLGFANPNGWSLLDCSTGQFLDPENPSAEGWEGFQAFRDKAIGPPKRKKPASKARQPKRKKPASKAKQPKRKGKRTDAEPT